MSEGYALTTHETLGVSGTKTGNWFDEVATPYYTFWEARLDVTLASPRRTPRPRSDRRPPGLTGDGVGASRSAPVHLTL
jgi:hypothetical protein